MSVEDTQNERNATQEEEPVSGWWTTWENNKGMFLILISEIVGSSMDAIVRFLQQGGHGMHPLQVSVPLLLNPLLYILYSCTSLFIRRMEDGTNLSVDDRCSYGNNFHLKLCLYVVD